MCARSLSLAPSLSGTPVLSPRTFSLVHAELSYALLCDLYVYMCLTGFIGKVNPWFDDKWIATASGHKEDDKNHVQNLDHYRAFERGIASAVSAVAAGWPGETYFMYTCEIEIPM